MSSPEHSPNWYRERLGMVRAPVDGSGSEVLIKLRPIPAPGFRARIRRMRRRVRLACNFDRRS